MSISLAVDGYCEIGEVQRQNQTTHDENTKPTAVQVEAFITDRFHEINAILEGVGFDTPIPTTSTKASRILKTINMKGAAVDARRAKKTPGASGAGDSSEAAPELWEEYQGNLVGLSGGDTRKGLPRISLIDAPTSSGALEEMDESAADSEYAVDSDGEEIDRTVEDDTVL